MSLSELLRSMRDKMSPPKSAPATEVVPRLRDSAKLPVVGAKPPAVGAKPAATPHREESSIVEVTPFASEIQYAAGPPPPRNWAEAFPAHHKALIADLAKRGEAMVHWEIQDGLDLGVSEAGHTVAFTLHKLNTSATIRVELTLFKGQLAKVRVH